MCVCACTLFVRQCKRMIDGVVAASHVQKVFDDECARHMPNTGESEKQNLGRLKHSTLRLSGKPREAKALNP